MKTFQGMIVAALLGAFVAGGAVWTFSRGRLSGDSDTPRGEAAQDGSSAGVDKSRDSALAATLSRRGEREESASDSTDAAGGKRATAGLPLRPVFATNPRSSSRGTEGDATKVPKGRKLHGFSPAPKVSEPAAAEPKVVARGGAVTIPARSVGDGYRTMLARADAHFASGETEEGAQLVRGVFNLASHRADIDLASHVVKLLETDEDPVWRTKYVDYLKRRGQGGQAFDVQFARAEIASSDESPDGLRKAWTELSRAHDLAGSLEERRRVFAVVDPLLSRHVFSSRFSSLVETYAVKSGDNLTKIARRFQATPDSIRRLNRLSNDMIRARMRLRILPGRVRVCIDKSDFLLWVTVDDRLLIQKPIGLGKDNRTPVGTFVVDSREKSPTWYPPTGGLIPPGDPRNVLGTRWIGFRDTAAVEGIGIHGTVAPESIGKEESNGCIRMLNDDVELVFDFVPNGTKVVIQP